MVYDKTDLLNLWVDLDPNNWHRHGIPLDQYPRIKHTAQVCGNRLEGLHFYEGGERHKNKEERT